MREPRNGHHYGSFGGLTQGNIGTHKVFGVVTTKKNPEALAQYETAIKTTWHLLLRSNKVHVGL